MRPKGRAARTKRLYNEVRRRESGSTTTLRARPGLGVRKTFADRDNRDLLKGGHAAVKGMCVTMAVLKKKYASVSEDQEKTRWLKRVTRGLIYRVPKRSALREHACVRAVKVIREGDEVIPCGATGAIVYVIKGGVAYGVEFTHPVHTIVTASRDELAPV
jgi:hypothetical protein